MPSSLSYCNVASGAKLVQALRRSFRFSFRYGTRTANHFRRVGSASEVLPSTLSLCIYALNYRNDQTLHNMIWKVSRRFGSTTVALGQRKKNVYRGTAFTNELRIGRLLHAMSQRLSLRRVAKVCIADSTACLKTIKQTHLSGQAGTGTSCYTGIVTTRFIFFYHCYYTVFSVWYFPSIEGRDQRSQFKNFRVVHRS